jgi:hypothetical protein
MTQAILGLRGMRAASLTRGAARPRYADQKRIVWVGLRVTNKNRALMPRAAGENERSFEGRQGRSASYRQDFSGVRPKGNRRFDKGRLKGVGVERLRRTAKVQAGRHMPDQP